MNSPGRPTTRQFGKRLTAVMATLWLVAVTGALAQEPGQTVKPTAPPPEDRPEEERVKLDKDYEGFKFIEDDAPIAYRGKKILDEKKDFAAAQELKAYDLVLAFASKQTPELMAKYSEKNVPYANLFRPIRQDYLRELMHFEGKLSLVQKMKATDDLRNLDKIETLYEAWIYPKGHSDPLCLVVSELPAGVEVGEDKDVLVAFDAYFFKLHHYESRQAKAGETDKKQWRRAPLFLGKTFESKGPATLPSPVYTDNMLLTIVLGLGAIAVAVVLAGWWLKRGGKYLDEEKKRRLEEAPQFLDE